MKGIDVLSIFISSTSQFLNMATIYFIVYCQECIHMNSKKHNLLALALVIPTLFSPLLVWAHGDEHLDPNMKVDNPITAQTQAVGQQGMPRDVSRTIEIGMNDMLRFNPDNLLVKQGETIRLRITNNGKMPLG
jgi:hypothetical protein